MIFALVTVYQPVGEVVSNIEKILAQVDRVFICDNSIVNNSYMFSTLNNIVYLPNMQNLGLSMAFNKVLRSEQEYNFSSNDFIVFFDQDSLVGESHIPILISKFQELEKKGIRVGCLGPVFLNVYRNEVEIQKIKIQVDQNTYSVKSIITSSMVCRYGQLKSINFWNEEIFLDMADWDLCWRLIQNGFQCCVTTATTLIHMLGNGEKKVGIVRLRVGRSFRDYYQIRDGLYLFLKRYTPIKFKVRILSMVTVRAWARLIFLDNRKERLEYIIKGIRDFRRNIHGEFRDS